MGSTSRNPRLAAIPLARTVTAVLVLAFACTWAGPAMPAPTAAHSAPLRVAGELDSVRSETSRGKGGSSGGSSTSSSSDEDEDTNGLAETLGLILLYATAIVVLSPIYVPHLLLKDDFHRQGYYAAAPYVKTPGYMQVGYDPARDPDAMGRVWIGAATGEWTPVSDEIDRYGAWVRLEGPRRFGLDLRGSLLQERTSTDGEDQLGFVAGDLTYRFAESPRLQFRTGLGVRGLLDHGWSETGIDALYAADWMPRSPWVVGLVLQGGSLGSAGVFEPRATLGCTTHGWQLEAGYAWSWVGSVDLGGPVIGLRRWF